MQISLTTDGYPAIIKNVKADTIEELEQVVAEKFILSGVPGIIKRSGDTIETFTSQGYRVAVYTILSQNKKRG